MNAKNPLAPRGEYWTDLKDAVSRACNFARERLAEDRVRRARGRQAAMFTWREAEYMPPTFSVDVPELAGLPAYDWREQWHDPAKSFLE